VVVAKPFIRPVVPEDLDRLIEIERICFDSDRLSRRSFQRWIRSASSILLVLEADGLVGGYGLVLLHKGTRLARLYSIALHPQMRGGGFSARLLEALEGAALRADRLFMRLEVAKQNSAAIKLYERMGYRAFGELLDYYEDHSDALRMQKRIRSPNHVREENFVPWYRQTTAFTCGPASLMMIMKAIQPEIELSPSLELDLWREATTIFMTSGQGGCHPLGLALAAHRRHLKVDVVMSQIEPPFIDGVRSIHKKAVLRLVHTQFLEKSRAQGIPVHCTMVSARMIESRLKAGELALVMISSYRLNGDKAPHWVVVTASDALCFYLHDPDTEKMTMSELDCQYIPVAKDDFAKMLTYGRNRFSVALFFA
jgi:ribosomal protein S18 acetylase RimI-like enzyme